MYWGTPGGVMSPSPLRLGNMTIQVSGTGGPKRVRRRYWGPSKRTLLWFSSLGVGVPGARSMRAGRKRSTTARVTGRTSISLARCPRN